MTFDGCHSVLTGAQGFSAVHVAAITATCWILLLNALVGFQLLDDGTPASIGLISASAVVLFVGTGYIALDTAFDWTGHFQPSHSGENRNIALYVLYQLFPLVCLVLFYVLEAVLVLRVLGEFRPMSMFRRRCPKRAITDSDCTSLPFRRGPAVRHWPDLPVRDQCSPLRSIRQQDQRHPIRDPLHARLGRRSMGLLEQYHRGRLAPARRRRLQLIFIRQL